MKDTIKLVALFVLMLLLQVVCNRIVLFGVATPIIFIYCIFRLPISISTNWALTISFVCGLVMDIFGNTPGMNALACTVMCPFRKPLFNLFCTREVEGGMIMPSMSLMGIGSYTRYIGVLTAIYCTVLFAIQTFSTGRLLEMLLCIVTSTVLSVALMLAIDSLISTRREKRL